MNFKPEDIEKAVNLLYAVRNEYVRAIHGEQGGCDVDFEQCTNCNNTGDPIEHEEGCIVEEMEQVIKMFEVAQLTEQSFSTA